MKITLAAFTALALALPATGAHAEDVSIKYSDLNLASPEGQKKLEHRIDKAARQVCGVGRTQTGTRIRDPQAYDCYQQAKAQATRQLAAVVERQAKGG